MRRLTSSPKPGRAGAAHDLLDRRVAVVLADAQAEAHAVELGEVARALARQDQVVRRERVREVRRRDLDDLGTELGEQLDRLVEALADAGLVALAAELAHHADPQAAHVGALRRADDVGHRHVERGGVHRVVPGDHRVQQRGVEHRARARAGLVERGGERDEPVARDRAVRRLHADGAGDGRGLADRAAGVGADRQRRLEGGDGRGRAAARAAGDALEVPRVVRGAVGRVLGRGAHRELVHVGLAEDHDAGGLEPRGRPSRRTAGASPRGSATRRWSGCRAASCTSLSASGTPASGESALAGGASGVDGRSCGERALGVDVQEGVHALVDRGDPVEVRLRHLDRRHLAARRRRQRSRRR